MWKRDLESRLPAGTGRDRELWEEMLASLRPALLAVLSRRRVDRHLAEDVVQESLGLIWQRWETLRKRDRLFPWAVSILLNRLRTHLARRRALRAVPEELVARDPDPLASAMHREGLEWLLRGVRDLPPDQRRVLDLRLIRGLPLARIAKEMGLPREPLRRCVNQALLRLRHRVTHPSVFLSARAESARRVPPASRSPWSSETCPRRRPGPERNPGVPHDVSTNLAGTDLRPDLDPDRRRPGHGAFAAERRAQAGGDGSGQEG